MCLATLMLTLALSAQVAPPATPSESTGTKPVAKTSVNRPPVSQPNANQPLMSQSSASQSTPGKPQVKTDPVLAELLQFIQQPIDPALSKPKQAALKKKINRAKLLYNQRIQELKQADINEKMAPILAREQAQQREDMRLNLQMQQVRAAEAGAAANARNAEINQQRLDNELYRQYLNNRPRTQSSTNPPQ